MNITECFDSVSKQMGVGRTEVEYYPYSELKHTWRRTGDSVSFKVSDYLEKAPDEVLESLAWYLLCRAHGRRCPNGRSEEYLQYAHSAELWGSVKSTYLSRAKSLRIGSNGAHRDLGVVFEYVNSTYFRGAVTDPILGWVTESPSKRLGFYFAPLKLLAANSVFDSERVPRYALEFVVYHELLHHLDASDGMPRRRVHHTKEFKEQEQMFSSYSDAERWLRRLASECSSRRR